MITKEFVTAGKAVFTVDVPADFAEKFDTKPHYTFKVKFKKGGPDKKDPRKVWPDSYFVTLLTGPDNYRNYTYLGKLVKDTGEVRHTDGSNFAEDSWPFKIVRRVMARLWVNEGHLIEASGWRVMHKGKCGRCGRRLTVPESIDNGIGPECIKHVFGRAAA